MQHSKYRILGLVGQGQFGRVFCASVREAQSKGSPPVGQLVALKELSHQQAPTSEFLRELWFLITLQHPNIVTCRALEHTATGRYLVMDYCEGGTLRGLLKQERPLRLLEGLQLIIGVLAGLDYAHRRGVVHCDIKPENILLTLGPRGWLPRLSDFGIARRLPEIGTTRLHQEISPAATVGSPAYMAPERFYGLYSPMSDIYAVGILLFELLMGYRPFSGTPGDLMWAHLNRRLQLPDAIPEPLQGILKKSLEKLPARRFASASQMAQALRLAMYDPAVRQLGDGVVPWERTDEDESSWKSDTPGKPLYSLRADYAQPTGFNRPSAFKFTPTDELELSDAIATPNPLLVATDTYLYGAAGNQLAAWCQPETQLIPRETQTSIALPEPLQNLFAAPQGCCILTQHHLYWLSNRTWELEDLLNLNLGQDSAAYTAATDAQSRWLAVATPGKLQMYSLRHDTLTGKREAAIAPCQTVSLPGSSLPELVFLDRRHLVAIWFDADQKQPQTTFRVYTRRGTLVGTVQLSANIGQVIATSEPYTVLGVALGFKPAILIIQLWPLKVMRIPLETFPVCMCVTSWGYVLADARGQIIVFDRDGNQVGCFQGPATPKAIAPWGKTGLAIATETGEHSHLHFLDINVEMD